MDSLVQLLKDFGLPLGMLVAAVIVLWRDARAKQAKIEELYDRIAQGGRRVPREEEMDELRESVQRMAESVESLAKKARRRRPGQTGVNHEDTKTRRVEDQDNHRDTEGTRGGTE